MRDIVGFPEVQFAWNVVWTESGPLVGDRIDFCEVIFVVQSPWVGSLLALCYEVSCIDCRLGGLDGGDLRGCIFLS
jgi:hypothetical protein